ncbi:MAG: UTP--glucose-1-phosphate uridylyltransferase [Planctomycetes bacterium]|nr:UTP--glucose-1-phosphate uridylyltransferase [Planctomycetota bacterium]
MNSFDHDQDPALSRFGYDPELQERWQRQLAAGELSRERNLVTEPLLPPPPETLHSLPEAGTNAHRELEAIGRQAIRDGQLGVVILNGGMATRFGGVVKGVVPVRDGRSFLALAVADALQQAGAAGGRIPVMLMNSFATDEATRAHFAEHENFGAAAADIVHFAQFVALRMTPSGELFRTADGGVSPYGPGHGDFAPAFRAACLRDFVRGGGRYVFVRNVDNLGARISPAVLGHHIRSGRPMTAELTRKWPGDVGGGPYLHEGRVQLVEQVRYPADFDPDVIDVFNCNTMTFDAQALDRDFDLGWYYVEKKVEGRQAVQMEHLVGELTAHLDTNYLCVGREGPSSRFLPIKTPEDLVSAQQEIAALYGG